MQERDNKRSVEKTANDWKLPQKIYKTQNQRDNNNYTHKKIFSNEENEHYHRSLKETWNEWRVYNKVCAEW